MYLQKRHYFFSVFTYFHINRSNERKIDGKKKGLDCIKEQIAIQSGKVEVRDATLAKVSMEIIRALKLMLRF